MSPTRRFEPRAMTAAMQHVARQAGLPHADARLLQLTNNAVFVLPSAGAVVRVTRSHALHERVEKVVRVARWFAETDAPTIRLLDVPQPIPHEGLSATVWHYVEPAGPVPDATDLGHVLRAFHALGVPPVDVPRWDPVGDAVARLSDADGLRPGERLRLLDRVDELHRRLGGLSDPSGPTLVHGDAHTANLLRSGDGRVVLCDFDSVCLGPGPVDLVATAVSELRFGSAGERRRLADAYGLDVTELACWPVLRFAREVKMVVAAVPLLRSDPAIRPEFRRRLDSLDEPEHVAVRWTRYADLAGRAPAPRGVPPSRGLSRRSRHI